MTTDLIQRLRGLSHGFEEWRVESPTDGSYCMSYTRDDDLRPEQAARGWLAEHLLRHPDSQFAGYVVKKHVVKTQKDQALDEAADALERLAEEAARTGRNRDMWKGQCERQAAELAALRADAERYRAIRDDKAGEYAICEWIEGEDGEGFYRDSRAAHIVDAAIDAARKS